MADGTAGKFACQACGKQYAWKAELAGKKAKCKCGQPMTVPTEPLVEEESALYGFSEEPAAKAAGASCPACGQALAAEAVLCTACGLNLKTGQRLGTQLEAGTALPVGVMAAMPASTATKTKTARPAASRPAAATPYPDSRRRAPAEEGSGSGKLIVTVVAVLLILAGLGMTYKMMQGPADNLPAGVTAEDKDILKSMRRLGTEEAATFVNSHASRLLGNKTKNSAIGFIKHMYDLGAKDVRVYSDGLIAREIVIIMPDDSAGRGQLIGYVNRQEEQGQVPKEQWTKDVGQRYLRISVF